ncbi:MAG: hypothetical protein Q3X66_08460 [Evtepia sp.]|nr:hypothetical protein [Evtepia sp.]
MSTLLYETLHASPLPAPLVINNYIQNYPSRRYEDYLLEFINASSFFLEKSNGNRFHAPASEAHGEPDAISPEYQIDFKLLGSTSSFHLRSTASDRITATPLPTACGGYAFTYGTDRPPKRKTGTRLHALLRGHTLEELLQMQDTPKSRGSKKDAIEDTRNLFNIMKTKKHLFCLYTYGFWWDEPPALEQGIETISCALTEDFRPVLQYREKIAPGFETYVAFFYAHYLIVTCAKHGVLHYIEAIPQNKSPLFLELQGIAGGFFKEAKY